MKDSHIWFDSCMKRNLRSQSWSRNLEMESDRTSGHRNLEEKSKVAELVPEFRCSPHMAHGTTLSGHKVSIKKRGELGPQWCRELLDSTRAYPHFH